MPNVQDLEARIASKRSKVGDEIASRETLTAELDQVRLDADALEAKETLSDDEVAQLAALVKDEREKSRDLLVSTDNINALNADIASMQAELVARMQSFETPEPLETPGDEGDDSKGKNFSVKDKEPTEAELDQDISSLFRCSFIAKERGVSVLSVLNGDFDDKSDPTRQYANQRLAAAMQKTNNPALIPTVQSKRLIELLRPNAVVRNLPGVRQLPLPNGNLTLPRQNAAATASYVGEMANIPTSQPGTDDISLSAKKLTCIVVQSGEMMRHSDPSSDALIRDDLASVYRLKEDSTFLRATQTATIPGGFKYFADQLAGQAIAANATVNLENVTRDLGKLRLALRSKDVQMDSLSFIMSPRTEQYLMDLRDGNGNKAFPEMERGVLRGIRYYVTTQIPEDLGVGTNESEIYLVNGSDFMIGDTTRFELRVSDEAAYDDAGTVKAAYSQDAAVFRLIAEHDTAMRHNESVAYLSGVTWGA